LLLALHYSREAGFPQNAGRRRCVCVRAGSHAQRPDLDGRRLLQPA